MQQHTFTITDVDKFTLKVLKWLSGFNTFCFLDSSHYQDSHFRYDWLAGAGVARSCSSTGANALQELQHFLDEQPAWYFGHLSYELQTTDAIRHIARADQLAFPDVHYFEPEMVLWLQEDQLHIIAANPLQVFDAIEQQDAGALLTGMFDIAVKGRLTEQEYIEIIRKLQYHIHRGDCYEINFCQEFYAHDVVTDPVGLYAALNRRSPNPFSGLYRLHDKWLLCASPERFLQRTGNNIISQPIKGTLKHDPQNELLSEQQQLRESRKDQAENVMIVDLVRNDLSRICVEGTVNVAELFGIYSFPQVHQMISTVAGVLPADLPFTDIIDATFPMGSMTGAPKIRVMELIDKYELSKRGIFSGSIGYIQPNGDFDLNVVIRSVMYNATSQYLSYQVGSGITGYSNPESEWEECLLKARAIEEVLHHKSGSEGA